MTKAEKCSVFVLFKEVIFICGKQRAALRGRTQDDSVHVPVSHPVGPVCYRLMQMITTW